MIIEDDDNTRSNLAELLLRHGYETLPVKNSQPLQELACQFSPDLILADIFITEVESYYMIRNLLEISSVQNVPFLFLTDYLNAAEYAKSKEADNNYYLVLPYKASELLNAVEQQLNNRKVN